MPGGLNRSAFFVKRGHGAIIKGIHVQDGQLSRKVEKTLVFFVEPQAGLYSLKYTHRRASPRPSSGHHGTGEKPEL